MAIAKVVIVYNPKSTSGKSEQIAKRFAAKVRRIAKIETSTIATEYAGHAETIAKEIADGDPEVMIVSASGDGGYHEVINGVLNSANPKTTTGVLPAGNANDHYSFMHRSDAVRRIAGGRRDIIDVIEVRSSKGWVRYAHSYVGIGLTSQVIKVLDQYDYSPVREIRLAFWHSLKVRPVRINVRGESKRLDNLLFLNAGRMSKIIKTSGKASIADGKFEIIEVAAGAKWDLLGYVFKAITIGVDNARQRSVYSFTCEQNMGVQLDGETKQLEKGESLTIRSRQRVLHCIV